jgi:hypothetical protein
MNKSLSNPTVVDNIFSHHVYFTKDRELGRDLPLAGRIGKYRIFLERI